MDRLRPGKEIDLVLNLIGLRRVKYERELPEGGVML